MAGELHVIFYDMPTFIGEYLLVESRYFGLRHVTCFFDERSANKGLAPDLADFLDQVNIIPSMFQ